MGRISLGAIPENEPLTFTDESVEKMKNMMRETRETDHEYGATICRRGIDLELVGEREGYNHITEEPAECPERTEMIGSFHTHPKGDEAALSYNDIIYGLATWSEVMCVGCEDKIACFEETHEDIKDAYMYLKDSYYSNNSKSWDVEEI